MSSPHSSLAASKLISQLQQGLIIDANSAQQRLDRFLRKLFRPYPDVSLVMIFKAIRKGQIKILSVGSSDAPSSKAKKVDQSYFLQVGDRIELHQTFVDTLITGNPVAKAKPVSNPSVHSLNDFHSWIIEENQERLVINKPAGISIHPSTKDHAIPEASLYDLIKQYYSSRGFAGSMFQPNVAYRLDKDTSGLVIVAKTFAGLQHLNAQIRLHQVDKMYYTIVLGQFPQQLTLNQSIKKIVDPRFKRGKMVVVSAHDPDAQEAKTQGFVVATRSDPVLGVLSLVKVKLFTGRMHQIRVHMAHAGFSVLGDIVYGIPSITRKLHTSYQVRRQLLHCRRYSFEDMNQQTIAFEAPLLSDMKKIIPDEHTILS